MPLRIRKFTRQHFTWGVLSIGLYMMMTKSVFTELQSMREVTDRFYRLTVLPGSADGSESYYHAHMKAVLQGCGDVCRVDVHGEPSTYFDYIEKNVDCQAIMTNAAIDAPMVAMEPPGTLPLEMVEAFTYGGKIKIVPHQAGVLNQRYMGNQVG